MVDHTSEVLEIFSNKILCNLCLFSVFFKMWFYWHFSKKLLHIYLDSAHLKRNYVQFQNFMHIINEISDLKVTFSVKTHNCSNFILDFQFSTIVKENL